MLVAVSVGVLVAVLVEVIVFVKAIVSVTADWLCAVFIADGVNGSAGAQPTASTISTPASILQIFFIPSLMYEFLFTIS